MKFYPRCPQGPEGDTLAGQSFGSGPSGLATSLSRTSNAIAPGLGMSQPGWDWKMKPQLLARAPQAAPAPLQ